MQPVQRTAIALFLVGVGACGGGTVSPTAAAQPSYVGVYELRTLNGSRLPYTTGQIGDTTMTLSADVLWVNSDNTWSEIGTYDVETPGADKTVVNGSSGTYQTFHGQVVALVQTTPPFETLRITINGDTLTIPAGWKYVFTR
jgi:hypothetical protein